jgi:GNAT superfamily N-acetyltransferase
VPSYNGNRRLIPCQLGATPRDLEAVAQMHGRCSARSLLDRFRFGGRAPAAALDVLLRRPLSFVACTMPGEIIAVGVAGTDGGHSDESAEVSLLVEDDWQGLGIGREIMTHLAGAAIVCGYHELIAYPATSVIAAQRLMIGVGHTRVVMVRDAMHLHTYVRSLRHWGSAPCGSGSRVSGRAARRFRQMTARGAPRGGPMFRACC